VIKPSLIQRQPAPKALFLSFAFVLLLVLGALSSGCAREETRKELDFRFALPDSWEVDKVERLDTDHDGDNEWVILYAFDNPGDKDYAPIRVAVYDIAHREPKLPIVYPYHLQAPGWTFLGEGMGSVSVQIEDVVTVAPPDIEEDEDEIVVQNTGPEDRINRLSIYRWRDNIPQELRKRTDPHEILLVPGQPIASGEWYQCIGMFSASHEIRIGQDWVIVVDRLNDRSQLAKVTEYRARAETNGYLDASQQLGEPQSVCIDFAYDMPTEVAQSPYPEKIVMAYHLTFNQDPSYGRDYLTQNARDSLGSDEWKLFRPSTRDVCVKQISYGPSQETESEIESFGMANDQTSTDIDVRANPDATPSPPQASAPIQAVVQTTASYGPNEDETIQIEWHLVREAQSSTQQEVWKIDSMHQMR
jgi:hypothetical protein